MKRLEYTRYVAQGGDWGAPITSAMARQAPAGLLGNHLNLPAAIPPEATAALAACGPAPKTFSAQERATFDAVATRIKQGNLAYSAMIAARTQMTGDGVYCLTNSAASAGRLYWENRGRSPLSSDAQKTSEISLPVTVTVFPDDVYCPPPPQTWARHAAWEQPQLFTEQLRTAFKPLR